MKSCVFLILSDILDTVDNDSNANNECKEADNVFFTGGKAQCGFFNHEGSHPNYSLHRYQNWWAHKIKGDIYKSDRKAFMAVILAQEIGFAFGHHSGGRLDTKAAQN